MKDNTCLSFLLMRNENVTLQLNAEFNWLYQLASGFLIGYQRKIDFQTKYVDMPILTL